MTVPAPRLKKYRFTIAALFFLLLLAAVSAQGQTQITRCGTFILKPGNYVLVNDLTNCQADGIIIGGNSKDIVLNLAGHQITGSATAQRAGIKIQSGAHALIAGPGVIRNYTAGYGISLISGSVEITGVTCTGNDVGFYLHGGTAMVHSNIANNNVDGFYMVATGELNDNLATGNTQDGIFTGVSERATFQHNTAAFNGRYGMVADRDASNKDIIFNTSLGNATYDLFDDNSTCQNKWVNNTFGTSSGPCIE